MGIDVPNMHRDPECILCGKCVRICNDLRGIGAINFINRGHRELHFTKNLVCNFLIPI